MISFSRIEDDLRRSMMKAKLAENNRVTRSESPDTQLGESLLDPPNSLSRIPRRYRSPSRSGSPSLETPEHLICRPQQPVPSHGRPPDSNLYAPNAIALSSNPFSWTQARYPSAVSFPILSSCINYQDLHQNNLQISSDSQYRLDCNAFQSQDGKFPPFYNNTQMFWPSPSNINHTHRLPSTSCNSSFSPKILSDNGHYQLNKFSNYPKHDDNSLKSLSETNSKQKSPKVNIEERPKAVPRKFIVASTSGEQQGTKRKGDYDTDFSSLDQNKFSCGDQKLKENKILSDEMQPCCSQSGKHLCSSLEDLSDASIQEEKYGQNSILKVGSF